MTTERMAENRDFRVYAIKYAHRTGVGADEIFHEPEPTDHAGAMSYYVWLVTGHNGQFIVDTGFGRQTARRRDREDVLVGDPCEALNTLGFPAGRLDDVLLSHMHFDHCGELDRFGNARFWLQEREMAYWTGPRASRSPGRHVVEVDDVQNLVALSLDGRVRYVDGDEEIAPGLSLHRVGGHTPGMQVVRVQTRSGPVLLASDATHYYANMRGDRPYSGQVSVSESRTAFDRVRQLAGPDRHVVPGHDPLVIERYPAVPGLDGIAVELTDGPTAARP